MTRQELIDNMVSCYDNGDAMLEYVEEFYLAEINRRIKYIENMRSTGIYETGYRDALGELREAIEDGLK